MQKRIAIRVLQLALILAVVALCTQAIGHWHASASDELHCQTCQAAHTANVNAPTPAVVRPLVPLAWLIVREDRAPNLEPARSLSIPRAPPV